MCTLGSRIRDARKERGLTQEALGEKAGIQKSAVAKYENNRIETPNAEVIRAFAQALGTTEAYLNASLIKELQNHGIYVLDQPDGSVELLDHYASGSASYSADRWRALQEANDFRSVWNDLFSPLPHAQYREVLQESGIRLLLDADAKVSPEDLEDIVEFIKFKQRKNGR